MTDLASLPPVPFEVLHQAPTAATCGPCAGGWFLLDPTTGVVDVRDPDATRLDTWRVPTEALSSGIRPVITVDVRHRLVVASEPDRTLVLPEHGTPASVPHPRWERNAGAALIDPGAAARPLLWAVVASAPAGGMAPQPPSGEIRLVDPERGEVLEAADLRDGHPEGYAMLPVAGQGVVLNGGYGQDGSDTWFLRVDGDRMVVRAVGSSGVAGSVDPVSREILVLPHDDTVLEILTWWDGQRILAIDGDELFRSDEVDGGADRDGEDEDGFGYLGAFLDADRLLATTWSDRMLVLGRERGEPLGWLDDDDALASSVVEHVGAGRLLVNSSVLIAVE